jgi:hypothetical protein
MQGDELAKQSPAARAAAWLAQYERNRLDAIEWVDRSWLPGWLRAAEPQDEAMRARDNACALAGALGLPLVEAQEAFGGIDGAKAATAGRRQSLALTSLPMRDQLRLLRVRALVFRRAELRRVLDLERRSRWAATIGDDGAAHLRWLQSLPDAPEMSALSRTLGAPALDAIDETTLAGEGYWLLTRDGVLPAERAASSMLRFGLPRTWNTPAWLARCDRGVDTDGTEHLLDRLPILFPEHAW